MYAGNMHASYINHMLCMNACMQVSICLTGSIGSTCLVASMSGMHKNGHCPCTVYRHCINTSCTQGYICHLLVVRGARADFDIEFDVWRARQSRLRVRSGGLRLGNSEDASAASAVATVTTPEAATLTEVQRKQRWRQQLKEYETKFNKRRPRAMTHLAFRISVINSLVKRTLIVMRRRRSARQTVTPAAAAESSEEEVPAETRGPGRPPDVTAPVIPHRVADKRKVDMVSMVCGSNRDQRKRVRAVQATFITKVQIACWEG